MSEESVWIEQPASSMQGTGGSLRLILREAAGVFGLAKRDTEEGVSRQGFVKAWTNKNGEKLGLRGIKEASVPVVLSSCCQ